MTVLVVDDSRIMRNFIKDCMIQFDLDYHYMFVEAEDGEEAFKLIQIRPVDLVLLDWNMPKLLGIDFLRLVRSIEKFKHVPIIMVTSETAKANIIEALKNGATDYLIKPIDQGKFKEKIAKLQLKKD